MNWTAPTAAELSPAIADDGFGTVQDWLARKPWTDPAAGTTWLAAVAELVADATVRRRLDMLQAIQEALREAYADVQLVDGVPAVNQTLCARWEGHLLAYAEVVRYAMEEALEAAATAAVEPGSLAERFLLELSARPGLRNRDLAAALGSEQAVDEGQLSRLGSRLLASGLVHRRRVGRSNVWELTPRGSRAVASTKERKLHDRLMAALMPMQEEDVMIASPTEGSSTLSEEIIQRGKPERMVIMSGAGEVTYRRSTENGVGRAGHMADASDVTVEELASALPTHAPEQLCVDDDVCYERVPV